MGGTPLFVRGKVRGDFGGRLSKFWDILRFWLFIVVKFSKLSCDEELDVDVESDRGTQSEIESTSDASASDGIGSKNSSRSKTTP